MSIKICRNKFTENSNNVIFHLISTTAEVIHMKKQKNLVLRLSLYTIGVFIVLFVLYNLISIQYIHFTTANDQEQQVENITALSASAIKDNFSNIMSTLLADKALITSLYKKDQLTSQLLLQYKNEALSQDEQILGYGIFLNERYFKNISTQDQQYITDNGYFSAYINRYTDSLKTDFIAEVTSNAWFNIPVENKSVYISEPYEYEVGGITFSMITISQPIMLDGQVAGVSLADFPVSFFNEIVRFNA